MDPCDKHVMITGAANGIGRATCKRLVEYGSSVLAVDRDGSALGSLQESLSTTALDVLEIDLSSESGVDRAVKAFLDCSDPDKELALVNNVGVGSHSAFLETDWRLYERVFSINVFAMMAATRGVLPRMAETGGGSIVNIASVAAQVGGGLISDTVYAASKGAVMSFTRAIAREWGPSGVRCNCVVPGLTITPATAWAYEKESERLLSMIPLGRAGRPEEVGDLIAYLAVSVSDFVSGAFINVDGATVRP